MNFQASRFKLQVEKFKNSNFQHLNLNLSCPDQSHNRQVNGVENIPSQRDEPLVERKFNIHFVPAGWSFNFDLLEHGFIFKWSSRWDEKKCFRFPATKR